MSEEKNQPKEKIKEDHGCDCCNQKTESKEDDSKSSENNIE